MTAEEDWMTDYEWPLYLTDVETEELHGVVAAYCATPDGHDLDTGLGRVLSALADRMMEPSDD